MVEGKPEDTLYVHLASKGMSNRAIARVLNVDEKTVRNGLKRANYKRHLVPLDVEERFTFNLDTPITVTDPAVAITADWHIPLYDPEYVNYFIETCRNAEVRTLIIGGDFFNFDALSQYQPKQEEAGLERELAEGQMVMATLLETFDRIVYVWGNHDARLHKALGFSIQFKEAMKLVFGSLGTSALESIEFSNLDHCWVDQGDGRRWYVCHPASYSRIPLSTPRTLAAKYDAGVISAHAHHCAIGLATDGDKVVVEAGGLFDRTKTAYLQRSTTFPTWAQGFCILREGETLYLDSPKFTTSGS
jgi:predicted phosphodiesterase